MCQPLSETFRIPEEFYPFWIRYIEKAATAKERYAVNNITIKLMRAKKNSISSVLAMSKDELRQIRRFTDSDEALLFTMVGRNADRSDLLRKI